MSTKLLVEAPLPVYPEGKAPIEVHLVETARDVLGYQPGADELPVPSTLTEALRSLHVQRFTPASVTTYKAAIVRQSEEAARSLEGRAVAWRDASKIVRRSWIQPRVASVLLISSVIAALGFALSALTAWPFLVAAAISAAFTSLLLVSSPQARLVLRRAWMTDAQVAGVEAEFETQLERTPILRWDILPFKDYGEGGIPTDVLRIAMKIHDAVPGVELFVHYATPDHTFVLKPLSLVLKEERELRARTIEAREAARRDASRIRDEHTRLDQERQRLEAERRARLRAMRFDPFLEVRLGDESYIVAVWDEEGYTIAYDD